MRGCDDGATAPAVGESVENAAFGAWIDRGHGVIQQHAWAVAEHGARQRYALLLAARQRDATLANHGVDAVAQLWQVLIECGGSDGQVALLQCDVRVVERNVVADGVAEQEWFLRREGKQSA